MVSITHVLSASSLAPSQLSWAASRQGTEEWPERSPRGDGIGPEGRPAGCTLGWQGRKAPCGLRSRGGGEPGSHPGAAHLGEDQHTVPFISQFLEHLLQQHELP